MTKRLLFISIFAAMSTASIHAQETTRLKADIPFSFHAGKTAMPAGSYAVQSGMVARGFLGMRSESGAAFVNIITVPGSTSRPTDNAKLVFNKYGGEYFLSEVWTPNSTTVATLAKPAKELDLVAKGKIPEPTILIARLR